MFVQLIELFFNLVTRLLVVELFEFLMYCLINPCMSQALEETRS